MGIGGDQVRRGRGFARRFRLACMAVAAGAGSAQAQTVEDLKSLSIEELANLQVSSVTKGAEPLSQAPAALFVITHDEIVRSDAQTLPEILRLAPNLFVAQTSAHSWVITARGLSGNTQAQNFPNKLLVLVDGRTVYNPLFSGVDWLAIDVVPEDIDRIEVISGPGATLWGANAMNGVVNIITRRSFETQGAFVHAEGGDQLSSATLRYGGRVSQDLTWRAYVRDLWAADTQTITGADAHDRWSKPQGGFQLDWTPGSADYLTLSGDAYQGAVAQPTGPDSGFSGLDLNAHWDHLWANGSELQVQSYLNRESEGPDATGGLPYWYDSYDLEVQHDLQATPRQAIAWGAEVRDTWYHATRTSNFYFLPDARSLFLADVFAQDTIAIRPNLALILGLKLEDDPFSGLTPLPSVRLSWTATPELTVWGSVQRAIRSPTPFDVDAQERYAGILYLTGNRNFQSEKLWAYEAGVRAQPVRPLSFSASVYYNDYDDLRTIEFGPTIIPLVWGNLMRGHTYGLEAWGDLQAASWWRLSAGLDLMGKSLALKPGASGLLGLAQAGDDPPVQGRLNSSMSLGRSVALNLEARYVAALPDPRVPAYAELNASLAWSLTQHVQLALSGFNLLHARHLEWAAAYATDVPRSVQAGLRLRF